MSRFETLANHKRAHAFDGITSCFVTLTIRRRRRSAVETALLRILARQ